MSGRLLLYVQSHSVACFGASSKISRMSGKIHPQSATVALKRILDSFPQVTRKRFGGWLAFKALPSVRSRLMAPSRMSLAVTAPRPVWRGRLRLIGPCTARRGWRRNHREAVSARLSAAPAAHGSLLGRESGARIWAFRAALTMKAWGASQAERVQAMFDTRLRASCDLVCFEAVGVGISRLGNTVFLFGGKRISCPWTMVPFTSEFTGIGQQHHVSLSVSAYERSHPMQVATIGLDH